MGFWESAWKRREGKHIHVRIGLRHWFGAKDKKIGHLENI